LEAPRPTPAPVVAAVAAPRAQREFRVLVLDQRGTGRSTSAASSTGCWTWPAAVLTAAG